VLVNERDPGDQPRVLFYLEHAIQDASLTRTGERRVISKRMLYVDLDAAGHARHLHYAPYLDYRPLAPGEPTASVILDRPESTWITRELEQKAQGHAIARVVPEHLQEVCTRRLEWIDKTRAAGKERLTKEISYWDHRAETGRRRRAVPGEQVAVGRGNAEKCARLWVWNVVAFGSRVTRSSVCLREISHLIR
jgi:hypothetical protein